MTILEEARLTPMEIFQARLDYAHHIKKAGIKYGSYDDVRAIEKKVIEKAIPIERKRIGGLLDKYAWKSPPFKGIGNVDITGLEKFIEALKSGRDPSQEING